MSVGPTAPDEIDVAIGGRLRLLRFIRGISQEALAAAIGVTHQQLQKYERGVNKLTLANLVRAAEFLQAPTIADLAGDQDSSPIPLEVFDHLRAPGAAELLIAYGAIADPNRRRLLVELVLELSEG